MTTLDRATAVELDAADPAPLRDEFEFPPGGRSGETTAAYFAGNSLGLIPKATRAALTARLDEWSGFGVQGHFRGTSPWTNFAETLAAPMARLVGAREHEVVVMNTLTVNLHMLMSAFYRPNATRNKVVIESGAFPSDDYAMASQVRLHGYTPDDALVRLEGGADGWFDTDEIIRTLTYLGDAVAVVVLGGINFRTGQLLDMPRITDAVHKIGALMIWDLAHAAGNVPMSLHDWDVDAAVWCNYKYINSGPGAIGSAFIHERHVDRTDISTLHGWWGNDPATRFEMTPTIRQARGAAGWQVSNPPILAMTPIGVALEQFDRAGGISVLRARSLQLTAYLETLLDELISTHTVEQLTRRDPSTRGAQISVLVDDAVGVTERLIEEFDVVPDERPPNVIRFAPIPLYTSYEDCWRAVDALRQVLPPR
jgi:kynureninase